jgi:hypothetical protein
MSWFFGRTALIYHAYAQKGMFAEAPAVIDQDAENEVRLEKRNRSGNPWKYDMPTWPTSTDAAAIRQKRTGN